MIALIALTAFLCHEHIDRYEGTRYIDSIDGEVQFHDGEESLNNLTHGDKPLRDMRDVLGAWSVSEFDVLLQQKREWVMIVEGQRYPLTFTKISDGKVISRDATRGFPPDVKSIHWALELGDVQIGGITYRLPVVSTYDVTYKHHKPLHNEMRFNGYQTFEVESRVRY